MAANPYELYKQQSVSLATQGRLVVMLYDGAIKNLNLAVRAIDAQSIAEAHSRLIQCQDIFQELIMSLDIKYPISGNLNMLYEYIKGELVKANIRKDREIIQNLLPLVKELRDTWDEAEKQSRIQNRSVGKSL